MLECAIIEGLQDVNTDSMEVVLDGSIAKAQGKNNARELSALHNPIVTILCRCARFHCSTPCCD